PPETAQSPTVKAILLYQDLLRFHQNDPDPTARLDIDLARLTWAWNTAFGENKNARFKSALKRFAEEQGDHELASMALFTLASVYKNENDLVEAHKLARRGLQAHPQSPGAKLCSNLISQIEAKSLAISTERLWTSTPVTIRISYRNVTNVWFRLVPWDWDELVARNQRPYEFIDDTQRAALLAKKPFLSWSHQLPQTTNYQTATVEIPAPANVSHGFYFLIASCNEEFSQKDNQLSLTDIWVTDITFVVRPQPARIEGLVLEATSGEPIPNAKVEGWYPDQNDKRVAVQPCYTDTNGLFTLPTTDQRPLLLKITANGQSIASRSEYWPAWGEPKAQPYQKTVFFTDRALYRPGQIIRYKGICIDVDREHDSYRTLADTDVTVVLLDVNSKEV
ncbi:MAG: hypothetical protein N3G20_01330, partial [Verrucomicrobiae bacterium]|nr:hypothetical protein [Verrucomicrobiae bacterium]